jgi:hypothetical protein
MRRLLRFRSKDSKAETQSSLDAPVPSTPAELPATALAAAQGLQVVCEGIDPVLEWAFPPVISSLGS